MHARALPVPACLWLLGQQAGSCARLRRGRCRPSGARCRPCPPWASWTSASRASRAASLTRCATALRAGTDPAHPAWERGVRPCGSGMTWAPVRSGPAGRAWGTCHPCTCRASAPLPATQLLGCSAHGRSEAVRCSTLAGSLPSNWTDRCGSLGPPLSPSSIKMPLALGSRAACCLARGTARCAGWHPCMCQSRCGRPPPTLRRPPKFARQTLVVQPGNDDLCSNLGSSLSTSLPGAKNVTQGIVYPATLPECGAPPLPGLHLPQIACMIRLPVCCACPIAAACLAGSAWQCLLHSCQPARPARHLPSSLPQQQRMPVDSCRRCGAGGNASVGPALLNWTKSWTNWDEVRRPAWTPPRVPAYSRGTRPAAPGSRPAPSRALAQGPSR